MMELWPLVSSLLGWTYTTAWSLSFYPQVLLNHKRRSVSGLSPEFLYLNVLGFACYATFNAALLFSDTARGEYRERYDGHDPSVRGNDVVFATHALLISTITLLQYRFYKDETSQQLSTHYRNFARITLLLIASAAFLAMFRLIHLLDFLYILSYIKLFLSFIKYLPQALLNFQRRSTQGWSVYNVLLDFTGGSLSLAQLLLDASINNDWQSVTGNPGKLGLAFLSMAFDAVFITQHYVLYPDSAPLDEGYHRDEEERGGRQPLLSS